MYTPRTRTIPSAVAAILTAAVLTFATVAPVEAGTGASACSTAEVNTTARPSLQ